MDQSVRTSFPDASATVVMPVHNASTTLPEVFDSLERQEHKALVDRVIIIDDYSRDDSRLLLRDFASSSSYEVEIVEHEENLGIARTLNDGFRRARSDLVIFVQPDIELVDRASLDKIVSPLSAEAVVGSYSGILHPFDVWRTYSFWQRCMFSRFVDREVRVFTPRFAALKRAALCDLDGFDGEAYRVGGEDGDLHRRAEQRGFRIVPAPVAAVHLHSRDPNFGLRDWIRKEAVNAEAQGALLRRFGVRSPTDFALSFFRELLLLSLAVPVTRRPAAALAAAYTVLYTANIFRYSPRDPRIVVLPAVTFLMLPIALAASVRGFVRGRQTL